MSSTSIILRPKSIQFLEVDAGCGEFYSQSVIIIKSVSQRNHKRMLKYIQEIGISEYNINSWTEYWEKVMERHGRSARPKWCPCKYPDGQKRELKWEEDRKVHGAHVLFQDQSGNYYGGIVPVSNIGNYFCALLITFFGKHQLPSSSE